MDKSGSDILGGQAAGGADTEAVAPQAWYDLIVRHYGLTFRPAQLSDVIRIVREQMRARGIASEMAYYTRLSKPAESGGEWDALVERLLNHETSFFRHPPSFDVLKTHILPELRDARTRSGRLNFWSAGCSTGQEAYSLAMIAMSDESLRGEFMVWGGDISRRAIEVARRGRYGPRAVATVPADLRQRFFRPIGSGPGMEYEVVDELRQRVRFMATNLVEVGTFIPNHDVIFCHNVLIYFAPAAVSRAVALLASQLAMGGYLLLGPGEAPIERPPGLELVSMNGVRVLQRRGTKPVEVPA
jgi:chemotaxis methyl-accepting protein methylase